jgi:hypothetical protein
MAKLDLPAVWRDVKTYRRAYTLTAIASFGGMLFGWDTGLIGVCVISQHDVHCTDSFEGCLDDGCVPALVQPRQEEP